MNSKTPLSILHQICLKKGYIPQYNLIGQQGRIHEQIFLFNCQLADLSTNGQGFSKKKARHIAAQNMLLCISQLEKLDHPLFDLKDVVLKIIEEDKDILTKEEEDSEKIQEDKDNSLIKTDNPVGELLDYSIENNISLPEYGLIDAHGMAHDRTFIIEGKLGALIAKGEGKSKKIAKRLSAIKLLELVKATSKSEIHNFKDNEKVNKNPINSKNLDDLIKYNIYPINDLILDNAKPSENPVTPRKLYLSNYTTIYLELMEPRESLKKLLELRLPETETDMEELFNNCNSGIDMEESGNEDSFSNSMVNDFDIPKQSSITLNQYHKLLMSIAVQQDFSLNYTHNYNSSNTKFPYIVYIELGTTPVVVIGNIGKSKKEAYNRALIETLKFIVDVQKSHDTLKKSIDKMCYTTENMKNYMNHSGNNLSSSSSNPSQLLPSFGVDGNKINEDDDVLNQTDILEVPIENIVSSEELEKNLVEDKAEVHKRDITNPKRILSKNKDWFFDEFNNKISSPKNLEKEDFEDSEIYDNEFDYPDGSENNEIDNLFSDFNNSYVDKEINQIMGQIKNDLN